MREPHLYLILAVLLMCSLIFLFATMEQPAGDSRIKPAPPPPIAAQKIRMEPTQEEIEARAEAMRCKISSEEALAPLSEGLDKGQKAAIVRRDQRVRDGLFRGASLPRTRTIDQDTYWEKAIASATVFSSPDEAPHTVQDALRDGMAQRIGAEAFDKLRFVQLLQFDPPVTDPDHRLFPVVLPRQIAWIAVYAQDNPVQGIHFYEGRVALDSSLALIDAEFPELQGGISAENFIGIDRMLEIARTHGFVLIGSMPDTIKYHNGRILLLMQMFWRPTSETTGESCTAWFDLQTGDIVFGPSRTTYVR